MQLTKLLAHLCTALLCLPGQTVYAATSNVNVYGHMNITVESNSEINSLYPWDPEVLAPQISALNALRWSELPIPMGIATLGMSVSGAPETNYQGTLSLHVNTGKFVFTVTESGPLQGSVLEMQFFQANYAALHDSFISKANSLAETGPTILGLNRGLTSLALGGAHHKPLMLTRFPKGKHCMWVTGDASNNGDADSRQHLGEIGVCKDFAHDTVRFGAGVGFNQADQDLVYGGDLKFNGNQVLAELDYQASGNLLLSAIGIYGWGDSDIRRGYPSLITQPSEISSGNTNTSTVGGRIRADLVNIAKLGQATVTPYLSYTHLRTGQDAYTETGGSAPAQFNKVSMTSKEGAVGMTAKMALSPRSDVGLNIEAVHRFDIDNTPTVSGQMMGLAFNLATQAQDANYWRASIDLDYQVSDQSVIALSLLASDSEPGPAYTGSVSWRISF